MTEHAETYAAINKMAVDPATAKDATILWLTLQLSAAIERLAQIESVVTRRLP